jgi:hypothetical protein
MWALRDPYQPRDLRWRGKVRFRKMAGTNDQNWDTRAGSGISDLDRLGLRPEHLIWFQF